jgi:hypothetical protein
VAIIGIDTASIRWRDDGTAPAASGGMQQASTSQFEYWGNLAAFQFIAVSGSPVVNVAYYRIAG